MLDRVPRTTGKKGTVKTEALGELFENNPESGGKREGTGGFPQAATMPREERTDTKEGEKKWLNGQGGRSLGGGLQKVFSAKAKPRKKNLPMSEPSHYPRGTSRIRETLKEKRPDP